MQNKVTAEEIIDLVKRLPDAESHIFVNEKGLHTITDEWLVGTFAGCAFVQDTLEEAANDMISYFYEHIGHNSIVGSAVTQSGFPNLKSVERYCRRFEKEEKE